VVSVRLPLSGVRFENFSRVNHVILSHVVTQVRRHTYIVTNPEERFATILLFFGRAATVVKQARCSEEAEKGGIHQQQNYRLHRGKKRCSYLWSLDVFATSSPRIVSLYFLLVSPPTFQLPRLVVWVDLVHRSFLASNRCVCRV